MRDLIRLGRERQRLVRRLEEIDEELPGRILDAWVNENLSFADIAGIVGLTRQRVHQIVHAGYVRKRRRGGRTTP